MYIPCLGFVTRWRYGLQFDVQRKRKADGSFIGHLWNWDYRYPWRLSHGD